MRFVEEVKALHKLHQGAVKIKDVNFEGILVKNGRQPKTICYYVMEFVEYGELFSLIEQNSMVSELDAKYLFRKIFIGEWRVIFYYWSVFGSFKGFFDK